MDQTEEPVKVVEPAEEVKLINSRSNYTSEIYKIKVKNLPKYFGFNELKKRLKKMGIATKKIKPHKDGIVYINLSNEEERQKAIEKINAVTWKGKTLKATEANPKTDPWLDSHKEREGDDNNEEEDNLTPEERVAKAVTPFYSTSYKEQLETKQEAVGKFLKKLSSKSDCRFDIGNVLKPIEPSPITEGYRNKNEFTIGPDKSIGFRHGRYKHGNVTVGPPTLCKNIHELTIKAVETMENYLKNVSTLDAFNQLSNKGNWKLLTIRIVQSNEQMAVLTMHPQNLSDEIFEKEKEKIRAFLDEHAAAANIVCAYLQVTSAETMANSMEGNCHHVFGSEVLHEELLSSKFVISPGAFFQVNTKAAEVLYNKIYEQSNCNSESVVLDVCCGSATIGISLARKVKKVIGIELVEESVKNAKTNLELNNITNVDVHCGYAEHVLLDLLKDDNLVQNDLIAVVDPPRAGLHNNVIKAIRRTENIKTVVYVSCNYELACDDFINFMRLRTNKFIGEPFKLESVTAVDLFPHTKHLELVLLFRR